ncbi:MAG: acetate--CoA ligase family protein [Rhodospirillaceae bacterium]|nr:acetate--CoA ligase family protein [Rhodospirillaceae bacterium]
MTQEHWLRPLLAPRSAAVVGASARPGSLGESCLLKTREYGFEGPVYPVNPRYEDLAGERCYASISALPEPVDLVMLCVGNDRIEESLKEAIAAGAKAILVFASCQLPDDTDPPLAQRLRVIAREANIPVSGGNGMGFYNPEHRFVGSFGGLPYSPRPGHMTLISHSGSSHSAMVLNDERLGYNLTVSPGMELNGTVADFMDYALEQPSTRVIGLVLETLRDPAGFVAALDKAAARDVPVVALKLGRTARAARLAISHSGAVAGDFAAYEALFDRYGVHLVEALDELASAMSLFAQGRPARAGGLAGIGDSGGERELLVDLADGLGVPLHGLTAETQARLRGLLTPDLTTENPIDAWGGNADWEETFVECFRALAEDPGTGVALVHSSIRDSDRVSEVWAQACKTAFEVTDKPVMLATNFGWTRHGKTVADLAAAGIPVIEGTRNALVAVRALLAQRDRAARKTDAPPAPPGDETVERWRVRLAKGVEFDEAEALALLGDFGLPVSPSETADSMDAVMEVVEELGYPIVLKTAMPGIHHKSDQGGVKLGLTNRQAVVEAYSDLVARLGSHVTVSPMAAGTDAVEMALGVIDDAQFGPLILIAAGGIFMELLGDRRLLLPPFGRAEALAAIDGLRIRPMLDGARGRPKADVEGLADAAARLSVLAATLGSAIAELDVNPLRVGPEGCLALDALVVPKAARPEGSQAAE